MLSCLLAAAFLPAGTMRGGFCPSILNRRPAVVVTGDDARGGRWGETRDPSLELHGRWWLSRYIVTARHERALWDSVGGGWGTAPSTGTPTPTRPRSMSPTLGGVA